MHSHWRLVVAQKWKPKYDTIQLETDAELLELFSQPTAFGDASMFLNVTWAVLRVLLILWMEIVNGVSHDVLGVHCFLERSARSITRRRYWVSRSYLQAAGNRLHGYGPAHVVHSALCVNLNEKRRIEASLGGRRKRLLPDTGKHIWARLPRTASPRRWGNSDSRRRRYRLRWWLRTGRRSAKSRPTSQGQPIQLLKPRNRKPKWDVRSRSSPRRLTLPEGRKDHRFDGAELQDRFKRSQQISGRKVKQVQSVERQRHGYIVQHCDVNVSPVGTAKPN